MRALMFAIPAAAALVTSASAQVSARIHIDIPIGRQPAPVVVRRPPYREIIVYDYQPSRFGDWRRDYKKWKPVTLYWYDGRYYERPFPGADIVIVYHRGHDYFLPPREYAWYRYDNRYDYRYQPRGYDYDDNYFGRARRPDDRYDGRDGRRDDGYRADGRGNRPGSYDPRRDGRDDRPGSYDPRRDGRGNGGGSVDPRGNGGRGGGNVDPRGNGGRGGGSVDPRGNGGRGGGSVDPRGNGGRGNVDPRSGNGGNNGRGGGAGRGNGPGRGGR